MPTNLPNQIGDLRAPNAAAAIMGNFRALAASKGVPAEVLEQAQHGEAAYVGTEIYRAHGAPTADAVPTGISTVEAPNGTMILTLGWDTYIQGTVVADFLLMFYKFSDVGDPGAPDANSPHVVLHPNTSGPATHAFAGLNPSYKWSFAIAAGRKTEAGLEIGSLVTTPSWLSVTIGTPNFIGTVGGTPATTIVAATTNFDGRNDRKGTAPADPTFVLDATAVEHKLNTDGSADIYLTWEFDGSGDAYDVDGFIVYHRAGDNANVYAFGTNPDEENVSYVPKATRTCIFRGVAADKYHTFGVRAYRDVDQDIDLAGRLQSAIVKPSAAGEDPYQPSTNIVMGSIYNSGGNLLLDDEGILNTWQVMKCDNVDPSHGMAIKLRLPATVLSIVTAELQFTLEKFRAYETGVASGGGATTPSGGGSTTPSGGGATSGASSITTTPSGGGSTSGASSVSTTPSGGGATSGASSITTTADGGAHKHIMFDPTGYSPGTEQERQFYARNYSGSQVSAVIKTASIGGNVTLYTLGQDVFHTHGMSHTHTTPNHQHSIAHTHTTPDHTHSIAHTHTTPDHAHVTPNHQHATPNHAHDLAFGIFEDTLAAGISVTINGVNRTAALGGPFAADQDGLNIAQYLVPGQWNTILLGSTQRGRIDAALFMQAMMATST